METIRIFFDQEKKGDRPKDRKCQFKARIPTFTDTEQSIMEIAYLENLDKQDILKWTDDFKHVQKNCGWTEENSVAVITTLVSLSILNTYAYNKRTLKSIIEALKAGLFPKSHYRRYLQKIDDLKWSPDGSVRQFVDTIELLVKKANECLGDSTLHTLNRKN
ncbi:hypothetical protein M153_11380003001 [Pseudoloma neurophilia]|uniref:Uncharacterized protein n=1 Tax=Pseudoloma neurophilia TaxID=146866 RepID=A0A0R0M396_9MICR|nr:hypothetical protein M153_11380003001 [Pseudoloma neurophilia]